MTAVTLPYRYIAVNDRGRVLRGTMTAENDLDVEARLKQNGLELIAARQAKERRSTVFSAVRMKDLIVLCVHMEQLSRAGVPLHEALADIRDTTESNKLRDVLTGVYESVKNGSMLSVALEAYPKVFNNVFVGLVRAGEQTGNLGDSFHHLAEHIKWSNDIRRKVKKAVRYPIALLLVLSGVITVLMMFVVPKMLDFIQSQGFTIPLHTKALIWVSEAFQSSWYLIIGTPVLLAILVGACYAKFYEFAYRLDSVLLRTPVIGSTMRKIDLARFTHFFAVMFNSGINILDSLKAARGVVRNRVLRESIMFVEENVSNGQSLTQALKVSGQFPTLVVRMFKVGEDSGNMHDALEHVNFFYDREVNDAVDNMVGMIQPMLTVFMGMMIFWIIAAIFGPLYQSFSKMKF